MYHLILMYSFIQRRIKENEERNNIHSRVFCETDYVLHKTTPNNSRYIPHKQDPFSQPPTYHKAMRACIFPNKTMVSGMAKGTVCRANRKIERGRFHGHESLHAERYTKNKI
ncbi:hypothetical protein ABFX02_10G178700 [Erythranthe guttata]